jgi:hypothetical protein
MANFGFLTGIGAAKKAAAKSTDGKSTDGKSTDGTSTGRRHHVVSIVAGILLALLIAVALIILFSIGDYT